MKQIYYIVQREFMTAIRQKSFLLLSIISPLVFLMPFIFGMFTSAHVNVTKPIGIIDPSNAFQDTTTISYNGLLFKPLKANIDDAKLTLIKNGNSEYAGIIDLNGRLLSNSDGITPIKYYTTTDEAHSKMKDIQGFINQKTLEHRLIKLKFHPDSIYRYSTFKNVYTVVLQNKKANANKLASMFAYVIGMLMYLMFIIFNNSLLRGVMEEKSNRIVEVFSMVVKPFNLMIGKIVGVGCVAFLQLIIWISLSVVYMKMINYVGIHFFDYQDTSSNSFSLSFILNNFKDLPTTKLLVFTPLFFIFGFLLNGAITTVIGATANAKGSSSLSMVSNFLNICSIYVAMFSAGNPENVLAKVSLYIPFFSPIVLPALLPYNLSLLQIFSSLMILILSFFLLVMLAGKIYRISIVSYGNNISFGDIVKMVLKPNL
mgnify:FL=1